jgi:glucose/arabinose dehydrogenase/cytochrome c551/c552
MKTPILRLGIPLVLATLCAIPAVAQQASPVLGEGPWVFSNMEEANLRVSVVARNLDHPFGIVFIPGTSSPVNPLGDVLINERTGKIRLYRDGRLREQAIVDLTDHFSLEQLFDLKMHPDFARNGLLYFTWIKTALRPDGSEGYYVTTSLGRARWTGQDLVDIEEVFEAQAWSTNFGGASSRLHFMADGTILLGVSHRLDPEAPLSLASHIGKVLRINDDGSVPRDNPFVGVEGALPEIYSYGNRSVMDFTVHPETGAVWELENGPQGGDEVNIMQPGANYGWPAASYGRDYDGTRFAPRPWIEGMTQPELFWVPSITVAGLHFYTGDVFPRWKNNLFVTSMIRGRIPGTGHLERVVFNENGEQRRESLLKELHQRIRYVTTGPDGLLYVLTDENDGALLRLKPTDEPPTLAPGMVAPEEEGERLISDSDCAVCHRMDNRLVGPAYSEIAARYESTEANISMLVTKVMEGGEGAWGEFPMTSHADLDRARARAMVMQILALDE